MADQVPKLAEEAVITDVHQADDKLATIVEKESPASPVPEFKELIKPKLPCPAPKSDYPALLKTDVSKSGNDERVPVSSFKEESTLVSDLLESERTALDDLKGLIKNALIKHEFTPAGKEKNPVEKVPSAPVAAAEYVDANNNEAEKEKNDEAKDEEAETPVVNKENANTDESEKEKTVEEAKDEITKTLVVIEENVNAEDSNVVLEDDGAKTLEAIEETIVAVSSSVAVVEPSPLKEDEEKAALPLEPPVVAPEEVSIWGIPLLKDNRSDVILLKFLRARDFKANEAFYMIKKTIQWREEFGIEELLEQDMGDEFRRVVFTHGIDKRGHPVCYNVYGEFQNKELYQKTFSDEEKRLKFLKWRIQFLEKSIRKLDFTPGGICTFVQVNDLKNSPGPGKRELRQATKQALQLLQDNYPEFVAKQVFINVPWWYLAVNKMISPFLTQRTSSKFVFAGPSKSAETLSRYVAAEHVPVKYGGLCQDGEFSTSDAATVITVRPAAKHTIEFPVTESCIVTWEMRVLGWKVKYGADFVPSADESNTVVINKARKMGPNEDPVICNSFKIGAPGKVVLTIDNPTSKKKKLLYRLKAKPSF